VGVRLPPQAPIVSPACPSLILDYSTPLARFSHAAQALAQRLDIGTQHYEGVTLAEPFSIRKTTIFLGITLVRESTSHLLMRAEEKTIKNYGQVFA
jgi:hypothetical protein